MLVRYCDSGRLQSAEQTLTDAVALALHRSAVLWGEIDPQFYHCLLATAIGTDQLQMLENLHRASIAHYLAGRSINRELRMSRVLAIDMNIGDCQFGSDSTLVSSTLKLFSRPGRRILCCKLATIQSAHRTRSLVVYVKPGMFKAHINHLNNVWCKFLEEQITDRSVVSYGVLGNTSAREGEPDLHLRVTDANWAALD
jgi:hypothetical protein